MGLGEQDPGRGPSHLIRREHQSLFEGIASEGKMEVVGLSQADVGELEGSEQSQPVSAEPSGDSNPPLISTPSNSNSEAAKGQQGLAGQFAEGRI